MCSVKSLARSSTSRSFSARPASAARRRVAPRGRVAHLVVGEDGRICETIAVKHLASLILHLHAEATAGLDLCVEHQLGAIELDRDGW